jgi:hypothetical protein
MWNPVEIGSNWSPLYTSPQEREPSEWQPIESAPKDGTDILAIGRNYGQDNSGFHYVNVHSFCASWLDSDGEEYAHLTHWMPLPKPPEISKFSAEKTESQ